MVNEVKEEHSQLECVGLDMFSQLLPEADAYLMTRVLHDWPDNADLLKRIQRATSKLLVVDRCEVDSSLGLLSLNMYLVGGGEERSMAQFKSLFRQTGWSVSQTLILEKSHVLFVCEAN